MKVEHIEKFDGLREDEGLIGGIASPGPQKGVQNLVNDLNFHLNFTAPLIMIEDYSKSIHNKKLWRVR